MFQQTFVDDESSDDLNLNTLQSSADSFVYEPAKKIRKQIRPRVLHDWSADQTSDLIKAVESRASLWNKSLAEYKLPKLSSWQEVCEDISHSTPEQCKAKWTNLRVTFSINLAKLRSTKSGQGTDEAVAAITWRYFKSMLFLEAANVHPSSKSPMSLDRKRKTRSRRPTPTPSTSTSPSPDPCLPTQERKRRTRSSRPTPTTSTYTSPAPDFVREIAQVLQIMSSRAVADEFSAFGECLAAELRSMAPDRASFVKRRIYRAMLDAMDETDHLPHSASHVK